ncbi:MULTISPECIES: hypothetical protein [unclassified Pantoea]|uniref:hypothetical protein n=1 Tax=unclassified Pantoea TaxID=2630326 RepID=UPI001CC21223|nr:MULTISPECIES: hypothetical protein [unclassified Pantoea]
MARLFTLTHGKDKGEMKYLLFALCVTSCVATATQMEGFGASYYQDDLSIPDYDPHKSLVPDIIVGDNIYTMELSRLTDMAKTTGVTVNQDNHASWLCLASEGVNYWFISDNEMGHGDLTSIAIARAEQQGNCSPYKGHLSITIKGTPLLDASFEKISSIFLNKSDGNIVQYCTNTKNYGDFTQMNCLQYFFENKSIKGVIISQITSN